MRSDNGTAFVDAASRLREVTDVWESAVTQVQKSALSTEWIFITPSASHQGRIWETADKTTKHYLKRSIGAHMLTNEDLTTPNTQVEAFPN